MRPSEGRITLWPVAVLAIIVVLGLLSFDLPMRLRAEAPPQFKVVPLDPGGKPNLQLADEYWRVAVTVVQWKYPFGSPLPQTPPPEFALPMVNKRSGEVARQQYWNALRGQWSRPEVWRRSLEFDVSWAGRAVRNLVGFLSTLTGHSVT